MDTSLLLLLIFLAVNPSVCSASSPSLSEEEESCDDSDPEYFQLLEGEGFHVVPLYQRIEFFDNHNYTWYKNSSQISTDKKENVHCSGPALFILRLFPENSGLYTLWEQTTSGECYTYHVQIDVLEAPKSCRQIKHADENKKVTCPNPVKNTCEILKGNITWDKDSKPLQGRNKAVLWVYNSAKKDEGIYTCTCTWTHNHKSYKSSGCVGLKNEAQGAYRKLEIISPTNKVQLADKGFEIKLNCSVFCGTNVKTCEAWWLINEAPVHQTGYSHTTIREKSSINNISTAILTIKKVSAEDFTHVFKCKGRGVYETLNTTLTLKQRESVIPLVIKVVCVLCLFVFAAILVRCAAIDLALFFRPYFTLSSQKKDDRMYDAYVIYQMQNTDKATEDALCQFVTKHLPSVLETKCGYRLFIHGRDDIPGEDRLELVEDRMKQSKRLMVILTPSSGSGCEVTDQRPASPQTSIMGEFDWQVGLHHALIQREMSVILIQLGDTGPQGYTHLPPGLQHLIRKSSPVRWPEGSRNAAAWNSRFWKRVRYLMPAVPAKKDAPAAVI